MKRPISIARWLRGRFCGHGRWLTGGAAAVLAFFVTAGLAAPLVSMRLTRFAPDELHPELAFAPPGARAIPRLNPRYDGDSSAFAALDHDGDGLLRCYRRPSPDGGVPLLAMAQRDWPVIHEEIVASLERLEARGVMVDEFFGAVTGRLVCPALDKRRVLYDGFYATLLQSFDGGAGVPADGELEIDEYPHDPGQVSSEVLAAAEYLEWPLLGRAGFARLDLNGDGKLHREEILEATRSLRFNPVHLLKHHDRDGDLAISAAEFPGLPRPSVYLLGADSLGRCLLTRLLYGARVSLAVGFGATALSLFIGILFGGLAGGGGSRRDEAMMRFVDVLHGLPFPLVVIMALVVLGRGLWALILLLGVTGWMTMARVVRGQVRALRQAPFVEAARAYGARPGTIIGLHLLRNAAPPVLAYAVLMVPGAMLGEAFLSFLGLGVAPDSPSWGASIAEGAAHMASAPWLLWPSALALGSTLMAFHLVVRCR